MAGIVGKGRKTGGGVGDEKEGRRMCWPEESGSRGVNRRSKNEGKLRSPARALNRRLRWYLQ